MYDFQSWFAQSPIASYLRSLAAIVAAQAITEFSRIGRFDFTNLESWIIAALVATVPVLLRIINPQDALS